MEKNSLYKKFFIFIFVFFGLSAFPASETKKDASINSEIRVLCKEAQNLERDISKLKIEIESITKKEMMSVPVIKNVYEVLARCFTILFNLQRFSSVLVLIHQDNKNDFVRCSIVIKNFASYFKSISSKLGKEGIKVNDLRNKKMKCLSDLALMKERYEKLKSEIEKKSLEMEKTREENIIQNDVVYHIATKSESIDELDAELEAENVVGVLKNTKVCTSLSLAYPVFGKIVAEFGDRGQDNEMIYNLSLETTCPGAVVTSPAKGLIVFAGKFLNYGNMIILSNGEYRIFMYGIETISVATGDVLEIGDYIGKMSETETYNPVIKMELRKSGEPLDPRHWLLETIEKERVEK